MKHLLILFLLLTTNAFAQGPFGDYAVVKDKDGYVNIRAKESVKSKIVGTLPNNTLVYGLFDTTEDETGEEIFFNWIAVDKGYVHQSRLKKISDFRAIEVKVQGNSIIFDDKDVKVTITKQKFDKTKHKITKKEHDGWTELIIDGKAIYGIDIYGGNDDSLPEDHYKSITVTMKGKNVPIPKSAYDDLYQIFYFSSSVYYDKEAEALYILAHNSENASAYEVCWQIVKGEYITRIIGQPF
ncbi:SH3 domain-containing protein [Capnocytophaga leadbetteri]